MKTNGRITKEEVTSTRRAESRYTELQPVRRDFYDSTSDLIRTTRAERDKSRGVDDFALTMYIGNLNRIQSSASEIMRMRQTKVARLAVASAFKTDIVIDNLTPEEREFFEKVKALSKEMLDNFERECGIKTYSPKKIETFTEPETAPRIPVTSEPPVSEEMETAVPEDAPPADEMFEDPDILDGELMDDGDIPADDMETMQPESVEEVKEAAGPENDLMTIRVLQDVPPFQGYDNRQYALHREDIVCLPVAFANLLIGTGQAVAVKVSAN